jgi:hypothetical protein
MKAPKSPFRNRYSSEESVLVGGHGFAGVDAGSECQTPRLIEFLQNFTEPSAKAKRTLTPPG